jgi:hypothetical protein
MSAIKGSPSVVWIGAIARGAGRPSGGSSTLDDLLLTAASRLRTRTEDDAGGADRSRRAGSRSSDAWQEWIRRLERAGGGGTNRPVLQALAGRVQIRSQSPARGDRACADRGGGPGLVNSQGLAERSTNGKQTGNK